MPHPVIHAEIRVESHHLTDGDELQIGKFKLTYLER